MADAEKCKQQRNTIKISSISRKYTLKLMQSIKSRFCKELEIRKELTTNSEKQLETFFDETFSRVFKHNIVVDGKDWCCTDEEGDVEMDSSAEFEPLDQEKKDYFNQKLIEEMEEATLKLANNRRHIGQMYKRKLKELAMADIETLVKCQFQPPDAKIPAQDGPACKIFTPEDEEELRTSCNVVHELSQKVTGACQRLDNIIEQRKMFRKRKTSKSDVYEKTNKDISSSSGLKRKLVFEPYTLRKRKK